MSYGTALAGLTDAVLGRPVSGIPEDDEHASLAKRPRSSANIHLGAIPALGLDAFRRHNMAKVSATLDWTAWYCTQPLHENEALNPNPPYRNLLDQGCYGLALLAALAGENDLADLTASRGRASVGWSLLGISNGHARKFVTNDPQPISRPHLLVADGAIEVISAFDLVPAIATAGMRGMVREPTPGGGHAGKIDCIDKWYSRTLVAQALGYDVPKNREWAAGFVGAIAQRAPQIAHWGLSDQDMSLGRAFVADHTNAGLARQVYAWILGCLPNLPFSIVCRMSGAIEVAMRHAHDSSTGAIMVQIILPDGTRYWGTADNGQRGGPADSSRNHQPQDAIETPDAWLCHWTSGEGEEIAVPRPPASDAVAWRVDTDGDGGATFTAGEIVQPNPGPAPLPIPVPVPPKPTPSPLPPPVPPRTFWQKLGDWLERLLSRG